MLRVAELWLCVFAAFAAGHALLRLATARVWPQHPPGASRVRPRPGRFALPVSFVAAEATMLTLMLSSGALPLSSWRTGVALPWLAVCAVSWELWFYVGHRLMHTRWLYRIHRPHHDADHVAPSLRFTAMETVFLSSGFYVPLVLGAWTLQAVSAPSLAFVFAFAYVCNLRSHAHVAHNDARSRFAWLAGPAFHATHHEDARVNFGLLTPWVDRALGTLAMADGASPGERGRR